jgi:Lon protease-like protein
MSSVIEIPLFPLRSVLCPGVALPLHIFEQRYRTMIHRCIERDEPFGVVLLREGREVGPLSGRFAEVGTTAAIRRAGVYPDGRLDILTVGTRRFRIEHVDAHSEPYLLGRVTLLDEPTGPQPQLSAEARRVGRRFLEYLELLQPPGAEDGPEIEIEFELEIDDDTPTADGPDFEPARDGAPSILADDMRDPAEEAGAVLGEMDTTGLPPEERRELLMAAARRLTATDDPTALSYVLTALIQVDLGSRQQLLEAPDTVARLTRLDGLLSRESWFLRQGLRPLLLDPQGGRSAMG